MDANADTEQEPGGKNDSETKLSLLGTGNFILSIYLFF